MKTHRILVLAPLLLTLFTACSTSPASQPTGVPTQIPPTPTPVELSPDPVPIPEENTLYLGTSKWLPVLFIRNQNSNNPDDPYIGSILPGHRVGGPGHKDFRKVENPQLVYVSDEEIERVDDFAFKIGTLDKLYLLLTFNTETEFPSKEQRLIEINLDTLESKVIWTYLVGYSNYGEHLGSVWIDQLYVDSVLVLNINDCYACEPRTREAQILINAKTGQEKFLGSVEDIYINTETNTVTYREIGFFSVPCDETYYLGSCPFYGGVGEFISEELP